MAFSKLFSRSVVAVSGVLSALLIVGCSGPTGADADDSESSASESVSGETPRTIVFDYPYTTLPVYPIVLAAAEEAAEAAGYEILTTEDEGSLDRQVANLNSLINKGVGAIVSFPIETSALGSVLDAAHDAGTKWITYGGNMDGEDGFLDLANQISGEMTAELLGEWLDAEGVTDGTVLVLGNDTVELGRQRTVGMLEGLAKYAPQLEVIEEFALGADEGASVTKAKLISDPSINYVLAVNDDTAIGAGVAFAEAGMDVETSYIVGNDGAPNVLKDIRDGEGYVKATIALNLSDIGKGLVEASIAALEGEVADYVTTPLGVTKDSSDLDDLIAQFE